MIVASVGTYSGPAGVSLAPMLQGVQLWVKHVNEIGGLNGHSVRLLSYDDGGDPARHRAQVQEAVEGKHAIAFVMNAEGIGTGQGSVEYLNAKRVPVIGMDGGSGWAYSSPMYFPQMSQGQYNTRMTVPSIARQLVPQGKTKLGTLICVEAPICDETDRVVAESVEGSGLEHVYRGRGSLAQPDFTAECLSARNAGAQILFITLDQNSVGRVAASCARQGYRPTFSVVQQVASRTMADNPDFAGLTTASPIAPYFQAGTPATDEFQAATRASGIASSNGFGGGTMLAWAAGKLLEKAGARMTEPPTSDALLAELWSMNNETLGGLVPPLTFVKDQPPKPYTCWYDMTIKNKVWVSPDGFKLYCL